MEQVSLQLGMDHDIASDAAHSNETLADSDFNLDFGDIMSELSSPLNEFESLNKGGLNFQKSGGNLNDLQNATLKAAEYRADLYKIETVATMAQNVIGTFRNFVSTFTR